MVTQVKKGRTVPGRMRAGIWKVIDLCTSEDRVAIGLRSNCPSPPNDK